MLCALEEELAFVFVHGFEESDAGIVLEEEGVVADVVDVSRLSVEVEKEGATFLIHVGGVALVDGAEVVGTGVDGEAHVTLPVGGAEPRAVQTDVDLFGDEGIVDKGFDDKDEGFAGRRLGGFGGDRGAPDVVVGGGWTAGGSDGIGWGLLSVGGEGECECGGEGGDEAGGVHDCSYELHD